METLSNAIGSTMRIKLTLGTGEVQYGTATVEPEVVMSGSRWWPGVVVEGFSDWHNECIGCGINEGSVLGDINQDDSEHADMPECDFAWQVIEASSITLVELCLQDNWVKCESMIRTEDGREFVAMPGCPIVDGEKTYQRLSDFDVRFVISPLVVES